MKSLSMYCKVKKFFCFILINVEKWYKGPISNLEPRGEAEDNDSPGIEVGPLGLFEKLDFFFLFVEFAKNRPFRY